VTPDYNPPETLAGFLRKHVNMDVLCRYSHIAVIDKDVEVPAEFFQLPKKYGQDIIGVHVKPSSRLMQIWEETYRVRLKERFRDCAVIYRTDFLLSVGGFPNVETPGTLLFERALSSIIAPITVIHNQPFSVRHSFKIQLRDGRSRVELGYPFWKTLLHGIVRLRPLVPISYAFYRLYGLPEEERVRPHHSLIGENQ